MKKIMKNPFISGVMILLIIISSILSYQLFFVTPPTFSAEELIQYANENSISYYQTTEDNGNNTGVVLSYYMPRRRDKVHAKVLFDERVRSLSYAYQAFTDLGKSFYVDNEMLLGFSTNQLEENVQSYTIEDEKGGTVELEKDFGVNPYREINDLYNIADYQSIWDNHVILNEKAAELLKVKVNDKFKLSDDITFTVQEIITPKKDTSKLNSIEFYDEYVDVPFIVYNNVMQMYYFDVDEEEMKLKDGKTDLKDGKSTFDQNEEERNARLSFDNIIEYRVTFANKEDAEKYLSVFLEYTNPTEDDEISANEGNNDGNNELLNDLNFYLKNLLSKKTKDYTGEAVDYIYLTEGLSYYPNRLDNEDIAVWGIGYSEDNGATESCLDVELDYITLYNTSENVIQINSNKFILNINNIDHTPQNADELNLELQPGEKKTIRLIYRYDYPGKLFEADATEMEKNEYRFDVIYYFIDEDGNKTEYMTPIKGGNIRSCVSSKG